MTILEKCEICNHRMKYFSTKKKEWICYYCRKLKKMKDELNQQEQAKAEKKLKENNQNIKQEATISEKNDNQDVKQNGL